MSLPPDNLKPSQRLACLTIAAEISKEIFAEARKAGAVKADAAQDRTIELNEQSLKTAIAIGVRIGWWEYGYPAGKGEPKRRKRR